MKGFWRLAVACAALSALAMPPATHAIPINPDMASIVSGGGFFFLGHTPTAPSLQVNAIDDAQDLISSLGAVMPTSGMAPGFLDSVVTMPTVLTAQDAGPSAPVIVELMDVGNEAQVPEPSSLLLLGLGLLGLAVVRRLDA